MSNKQKQKLEELIEELGDDNEVVNQWSCVSGLHEDDDLWEHGENGESTTTDI